MNKATIMVLLSLLSLGSFLLAMSLGSVSMSLGDIWTGFFDQQGINYSLIHELRLPRALAAFICGAMLALAGLLMQALLRNPLADPYILGVSGGAAVGALLAISAGLGIVLTQISAFSGAFVSILLVFILAHTNSNWTSSRLLLTGVILAFGWNALISFILTVSPGEQLHGMLFWLMGDLGHTEITGWEYLFLLLIACLSFLLARPLNLISRGEMQAASLGVNTRQLRLILFFSASLLTAVAISLAGSIGFIGLMTPHILRFITGSDHRILVPACILLGGSLLVLADTLARTVLAPTQLPVGILTAILGVPTFLYLLYRKSK